MASNLKAYNFISEPDANWFCAICLELASQPKQCQDCGKLFCSECIEKNGSKPCPNCRTVSPKYFQDIRGKQKHYGELCKTNVLFDFPVLSHYILSMLCNIFQLKLLYYYYKTIYIMLPQFA